MNIDSLKKELEAVLPECLLKDRLAVEKQLKRYRQSRDEAAVVQKLEACLRRLQFSREQYLLRKQHIPKVDYPDGLPVSERRNEIVAAIREHPVLIIAGERRSAR